MANSFEQVSSENTQKEIEIYTNPKDDPFFANISDDVDELMKSKNSSRASVFYSHIEDFAKKNPEKVKAYLNYGDEQYGNIEYKPDWYEYLKHANQILLKESEKGVGNNEKEVYNIPMQTLENNSVDTNENISPIELQALLAEKSAAEQAVAQKESELLIARQNLENINNRISKTSESKVEEESPRNIEAYTQVQEPLNIENLIPSVALESATMPADKTESILSAGEKRYEIISQKISGVKENAKTRISSVGNKLGNFFRKIKDFGYEIPKNISIAVLSTDKIIEAGLTAGSNKLDKGIGFVDNMYDKAFDKIESGVVGLGNWISEKAKATKRFTEEKAVLVASVAAYKAERTKEGLDRMQDSIFNQFRRLNNFMTEAGNFASAEVNRIKMRLKDEIIAYKMRELDKEIARDSMVAGNLEEAKQARLNAIKEKANKLISLRDGLSKVVVENNSQVAI